MSRPETEKFCAYCKKLHPPGTDYRQETGRPTADATDRMIGRTLVGKYRLVRCIGHGGMGTVFEAEHAVIGGRVAVKLVHEPFALSFDTVQKLYQEAMAAAAIGHPNVIQVMDVAETEWGYPFGLWSCSGESL